MAVGRLTGRLVVGAVLTGLCVPFSGSPAVALGAPVRAQPGMYECNLENPRLVPDGSPLRNDPLNRLLARSMWKYATGKGVVVAVVDAGVQAGNEHFPAGALLRGYSNVPGHTDAQQAIVVHGTAVAGLIGAREVSGSKVVGLAPDATILPVRVFASEEDEYVRAGLGPRADRIADGIRWAARNGADVVNVSMSTPNPSPDLDSAVAYATGRGALVVASAGNNESDEGETPGLVHGPVWPAAAPGALGVTAADGDDRVTNYSMHGRHVDVVAPGTDVLTTFHDAGDCPYAGGDEGEPLTSFATPFVSAVAALLMERYPQESPAEIAYRLQATADRPVRATRDDVRGWGFIRPLEALRMSSDLRRAGPPVPGRPRHETVVADRDVPVLSLDPDPLASARAGVAWWLMLGAALVALMLILGRYRLVAASREPRRRRRSQEHPRGRRGSGWADAVDRAGPSRPGS